MYVPGLPGPATDFRYRLRVVAAWFLWACCVVLMVLTLTLYFINPADLTVSLISSPYWTLLVIPYPTAGALIVSYHPRNLVGWLFCIIGFNTESVAFSLRYNELSSNNGPNILPFSGELIRLATLAWPVDLCVLALLFLFFPAGKLSSKGWRLAGWLTVITGLLGILSFGMIIWPLNDKVLVKFLANPDLDLLLAGSGMLGKFALFTYWLCGICVLIAITSLIFKFKNAVGVERLQLKWFAFTAAPLAVTALISSITTSFTKLNVPASNTIAYILTLTFICCLPVAASFAILKHHLYDIDILINRTLVYGSLTLALALVYFAIVIVLQALLLGITGQSSELAVVASTLAVAALFQPLRRGFQSFIDRRFYRRKYDATRTLSAFSATLQHELDFKELTDKLTGAVNETMQPSSLSLWLRQPEPERIISTPS